MLAQRNLFKMLGFFFFSVILFTWGLSSQEIIGFESRLYLFALEMWRNGPTWFPTTYQQPYADYPVTATFLTYLLALLWHGMDKFVAVFPSAVAASITLMVTYLIGALHSKRWGWYAVFFLLLDFMFLKSARTISLDMYTTMVTTCCFYLIYSADVENKPTRIWWVFPFLLVGFAFRGPIGLVMPAGVISIYYLLNLNFKKFVVTGFFAFCLLILGTTLLLALAYHVDGYAFMKSVVHMEAAGRMDNPYFPAYFYFTNSIRNYALSFIIAWLSIFGITYYAFIKPQYVPDIKFLLKLIGWMLIILIGMSIPDDKKVRYVLPMVPALALLSAYPFAKQAQAGYFFWLRWFWFSLFLLFPALSSLLTGVVYLHAKNHQLNFNINYLFLIVLLPSLQLINFFMLFRYRSNAYAREMRIIFIAAMSFVITYISIIEPISLYLDRARDFVVAVENLRLQNHARLAFYKENPDGSPIKYLINMPQPSSPVFIKDARTLIAFKQPAFFVTSAAYFQKLPHEVVAHFQIVGSNTLGHNHVVVFMKK